MKIAVVGLGLIGGSLCKALKQKTTNIVLGIDLDDATLKKAKSCGAVDRMIQVKELGEADIVFVCLHPKATVDFILQNLSYFKKGCIVSDVCGVKQEVTLKTE
ncbi:MAG: dehydrogenase, partial [Oscillospiraceae bacterium]|nr:dehydrogenase [Oscillospiraceae bacterium]